MLSMAAAWPAAFDWLSAMCSPVGAVTNFCSRTPPIRARGAGGAKAKAFLPGQRADENRHGAGGRRPSAMGRAAHRKIV